MFKKSYIVLIFTLLLVTRTLFGQGFSLGIFFDPTVTRLQSDISSVEPGKASLGFDFGMTVDYFFAENYAFASGISVFNTGGTLKYKEGIEKFYLSDKIVEISKGEDIKYNVQYVKIPLGLKLKTHLFGRMVYSANLGFDVMFRASANAHFEDSSGETYNGINVSKEIKASSLGWHFGGTASYHLGGDAFLYGGLAIMNTFTDMTTPEGDKITSQNLFFRIGMTF